MMHEARFEAEKMFQARQVEVALAVLIMSTESDKVRDYSGQNEINHYTVRSNSTFFTDTGFQSELHSPSNVRSAMRA